MVISYPAMRNPVSFRYFKTSPEIIQLAVMLYVRFSLSLRNVEDHLHERGVEVSYESVRYWWHRFGSQFACQIKKRRAGGLQSSNWKWHLDEVFVKIVRRQGFGTKSSPQSTPHFVITSFHKGHYPNAVNLLWL